MNKTPLQHIEASCRTLKILNGEDASYGKAVDDILKILQAHYLEEKCFASEMWQDGFLCDTAALRYKQTSFQQKYSTYEK